MTGEEEAVFLAAARKIIEDRSRERRKRRWRTVPVLIVSGTLALGLVMVFFGVTVMMIVLAFLSGALVGITVEQERSDSRFVLMFMLMLKDMDKAERRGAKTMLARIFDDGTHIDDDFQ